MFIVERQVGNDWEKYAEESTLPDAIFCTEEAFMQDNLEDEFYVYRVMHKGSEVYKSS